MTILLAGCSGDLADPVPDGGGATSAGAPAADLPPVLQRMRDDRDPPSPDVVEVWVCDVPDGSTAAVYGGLPLRLPLTPTGVVAAIGDRVRAYVAEVSHGRHDLRLVAGGTVEMAIDDDEDDCVDRALERSSPAADVVLAVSTAEHGPGFPGGRGRPGTAPACTDTGSHDPNEPDGCSARATGRAAVVGASDFHPSHGDVPLLDLVEHELGHTFGWPHSGTPVSGDDRYVSAIDLMSDSAAPRVTDRSRRDGPLPLAIDQFDAGWLPLEQTLVVGRSTADTVVELSPLGDADGTRLLVLAIDEYRVLSVEYRTPTGFDDHLPEAGVAVHLIDDTVGTGVERVQLPVHTDVAPFTDLLGPGDVLTRDGWRIEVTQVGDTARLAVAPTDG